VARAGRCPARWPASGRRARATRRIRRRAGVPGIPAVPLRRERRRTGLIIGIAAALVVLAGAGIGIIVVHGSGAERFSLPGTLLGLRKYDGPGAQRFDTRLARGLAASRGLVRPAAAVYGDPSGSGPWVAVAYGGRCTKFCGPRSARGAMSLALAQATDSATA
jgi:hypothetical protein